MGPKGKRGRKGKKEKDKRPKTPKSEYLNRIAEQNALLAAARRRVQEAENKYFDTEKKFEQTQEDMTDIIKYLQHEIQDNEKEIASCDAKIATYREELHNVDKHYQGILLRMKALFNESEKALNYKIRQHIPKLSAYEEIRQQREEFLRKKRQLSSKMEETQAKHESEIYEAEKHVIKKQDTMQKEMESRLTDLARDFNQATDIAIGETTNKLIRDNIVLGNMLTCTQEIFDKARESFQKVHSRETRIKCSAELMDEEYFTFLQKYTSQVNNIETLVKVQEELHERIGLIGKLTKENRRLQREIDEKECMLRVEEDECEELQKKLFQSDEKFNSIKTAIATLRKTMVNVEHAFHEVAKKVKQALDIQDITQMPEELAEETTPETQKEEMDEILQEFKYKVRQNMTIEAVEILSEALNFEIDVHADRSMERHSYEQQQQQQQQQQQHHHHHTPTKISIVSTTGHGRIRSELFRKRTDATEST